MAIRNDITIDWSVSPRIITVDAPSTEITMQDLYDTLRTREEIQIDEDRIVDGAGKEQLGGGVLVGITLTLLNALLAFEARPGADYVLCQVSGGNLVAKDDNGDYVSSPISPTAFTQIILANSSSATLQESTLIQQASFEGVITVDFTLGEAGTAFPLGTRLHPSNNWVDAYAISQQRGLPIFFVIGNVVLNDEVVFDNYTFIGESPSKTRITINPIADVYGCEFYECHLLGTLDGDSVIENGLVDNLNYIEGSIRHCSLNAGTITLTDDNTKTAHIIDSVSGVPGTDTPIIDMVGDGAALAIRNYNGGIKLINKTGNSKVSIDLNSGQAILDNTVISGQIVVRGVGKLIDINGKNIPTGLWNGCDIINETTVYLLNTIQDIQESDEEKNIVLNKYYKRHKTTKTILVEKNYNKDVNDNETLIEP